MPLILLPACAAAGQGPLLVSPQALAARPGVVVLDLRDSTAFRMAHVAGAVHWNEEPCSTTTVDEVQECLGRHGIDGTAPLVAYDQLGRPSARAGRLLWLAEWGGVPSVAFIDGGFEAWQRSGLPIAGGEVDVDVPSVGFSGKVRKSATAEQEWLLPRLGQEGVEILDLREGTGWQSFSTPPAYSAGHIPYSLPFSAEALLGPEGDWPETDAGRATLGSLGPRPSDPVALDSAFVVHGSNREDPRTSLAYLLLRHLGIDVRVLTGGWNDWHDRGLPVVRILSVAEVHERIAPKERGEDPAGPHHPIVTLDLREVRDYDLGHLPGSLPLPLHRFAEDFERTVATAAQGVRRDSVSLIFYCYGPDCVRSRKACAWAAALGYTDLSWFRGGTEAWLEAGLPLHRTGEAGAERPIPSPAP